MYGISLIFAFIVSSVCIVHSIDQCESFPTEVTFYYGTEFTQPGTFSGKKLGEDITQKITSIIEPLVGLYRLSQMNFTKQFEEELAHFQQLWNETWTKLTQSETNQTLEQALETNNLTDDTSSTVASDYWNFSYNETDFGFQYNETWGISVPLNTLKVEMAKIVDGKITDTYTIDSEMFSNETKTKKDLNLYIKNFDLTEFGISSYDLFITCLTMSVAKDNKQSSCQRCLLLRACDLADLNCLQKFISFRSLDSKVHPFNANLQYDVGDSPSTDIKLVTKVAPKPFDPRCEDSYSNAKSMKKSNQIVSDTILFVETQNLSPQLSYKVEADLNISFNKTTKMPFGWPNPLIVPGYLDSKEEYIILACGQSVKF